MYLVKTTLYSLLIIMLLSQSLDICPLWADLLACLLPFFSPIVLRIEPYRTL